MPKTALKPIATGVAEPAKVREKRRRSPSRMPVEQVSYAPLHEVVYQEVRRALMRGRFEPGQRLTVRGLSSALGTSNMPVRAALGRLIAERALVRVSPRYVAVPVVSGQKFRDLMETRILIEGEATARAASQMPEDALEEATAIGERLNAASRRNNTSEYLELNQKLKFSIYVHCGSPTLLSLIEMLWLQIGPVLRFFARDIKSLPEINFHAEAIAAIRDRDATAARRWMQRDIREGMLFLLAAIDFPRGEAPEV